MSAEGFHRCATCGGRVLDYSLCPRCTDRDQAACACGDYRHQHFDGVGKCGVCGDSSAPWDGCQQFRPAGVS